MSKYLLILVSFFVIAAFPVTSFAQEDTEATTPTIKPTRTPNAMTNAEKRELKNEIDEAKDEMQASIMQAKDDFKTKLMTIKDAKKKQIAENFVTRINEHNTKKVAQLNERLTRLTSILEKVSKTAEELEAAGKNVTNLYALIEDASKALEDAKEAVNEQAEKDYSIDITTETALKTDARETISQFITDMKAVFAEVVNAHRSVVKAFAGAKTLGSVTSPTPSGTVEE